MRAQILVDLVEEDDGVLLDRRDRFLDDLVLIEQLVAFVGQQRLVTVGDGHAPLRGAAAERLAEDVVQIDHAHLGAGHARDVHRRQRQAALVRHLDIDLLVVEFAGTQLAAERIARALGGILADKRVEHAAFGIDLGPGRDLLAPLLAGHHDGRLDEVADDRFDVAADIADFRELRRLDLHERRVRQPGQPPRDLGLADAGRTDHQNVFRQHLLAHVLRQLLAPPPVAQGDGDGAFGVVLPNDEAIEFGDGFPRREGGHRLSIVRFVFV